MMKRKGYDVDINPEKKNDKTAVDLIWDGDVVELKTRKAPFFLCKKYGIDIPPNFAIPVNVKDVVRYRDILKLGSKFEIAIWAEWPAETRYGVSVEGLKGVWITTLGCLLKKIRKGAPIHEYIGRKNDKRFNAKDSYYFDVRDMEKIE
jgi:hypothetical protein